MVQTWRACSGPVREGCVSQCFGHSSVFCRSSIGSWDLDTGSRDEERCFVAQLLSDASACHCTGKMGGGRGRRTEPACCLLAVEAEMFHSPEAQGDRYEGTALKAGADLPSPWVLKIDREGRPGWHRTRGACSGGCRVRRCQGVVRVLAAITSDHSFITLGLDALLGKDHLVGKNARLCGGSEKICLLVWPTFLEVLHVPDMRPSRPLSQQCNP